MQLSKRLSTIAESVPKNSRVADIGTDHGYLAIFLAQSQTVKTVIACDIRQKPLDSARRNIENSGVTGVETRLSDGFSNIAENETDCAVIAGIGGEVIASVLEKCRYIKNKNYTLILQPTTSPEKLREFLFKNGFCILSETAVEENNKLYSVMTVRFSGKKIDYTSMTLFTGMLDFSDETARKYVQKQFFRAKKCAEKLKTVNLEHEKYKYFENLSNELERALKEWL